MCRSGDRGIQRLLFFRCQADQLFPGYIVTVDKQRGFALHILGIQFVVAAGFFGAFPQWLNLRFNFREDIPHPGEVLLGILHLAHRVLAALFETGNPNDFLKQQSPFLRFAVENFINLILADDRHGFTPQSGPRQQFLQVFQAAMRLIDIILAFAGTKYSPGYGHFAEVQRQ